MSPRILAITGQPEFASLLRHHVTTLWGDAEVRVHDPQSGMLAPGFVAAGYDAVLLDHQAAGGGLDWLADFGGRQGFPPVIYLVPAGDGTQVLKALEQGAAGCVTRDRIDHRALADLLSRCVEDRRRSLFLWRSRPEAREASRFGEVTIRGHRCIRQIAAGGHSRVFLAESEKAGDLVVLKVFAEVPDKVEAHHTFNRFLQEYELVSAIRHPNIVCIHDLGIADDHAYIAMEYFPHGDLRTRMQQPLSVREALVILGQIARALKAIHGVGVLHRDLKPGNVMLRADGSVALIDFGLAKQVAVRTEMTGIGEIFGTPYYMSPEQGHGEPVDERSDLYSAGVLFHEMLTRRKPYMARTVMSVIYLHRNAPLPELEEPLKRCEPLLHRLLAKAPADRFQSAAELERAVDALRAEHGD